MVDFMVGVAYLFDNFLMLTMFELTFPLMTVLSSAVWNLKFSLKALMGSRNLICRT